MPQVKFDVPVVISAIQISDAAESKGVHPPILRIYARDSYTLSASRFAPLSPNTISCSKEEPTVIKADVRMSAPT
jgi:hypothetical protein